MSSTYDKNKGSHSAGCEKKTGPGGEKKNKGGRPRFDFSDKMSVISQLAAIACTDEEIAAAIGCSQDTLARGRKRDADLDRVVLDGRAKGRVSIRRAQYKRAMSGNSAMLIWLGKQMLGQKDHIDLRDEEPMPQKVVFEVKDCSKKNE